MGIHNLLDYLKRVDMETSGAILKVPNVGYMIAWGTTVPTDGGAIYAPGCIFIHTDGSGEAAFYINQGTSAACDFKGFETALQDDLAAVTNGKGAAMVGVEDSANNFAGATIEAVLAEIIADYAAVTNGNGASKVGVEDSAGYYTATNVEAALAEIIATFGTRFDTAFPAGGSNTGRGPSTGIWSTCPVIDYMLDPTKGMVMFNDFHGGYALASNQTSTYLGGGVQGFTGATTETITSDATDPNGVCKLLTSTDNESAGISLLGSKNAAGQFVLTSGKKSWFEARIKTVNIDDSKYGLFCGFAEEGLLAEDGLLGDTGALPDKDYIGFLRVEADGDKLDTVHRKASGAAVVVQADAVTVVANTYIKVGFYCDGTTVTFYANGVALSTTCLLATATVPTAEEMAFYLVLAAASDDDATASIDWVRIAREF